MKKSHPLRSAFAVNTVTVAAAAAAGFLLAYGLASPAGEDRAATPQAKNTAADASNAALAELTAYTDATTGDCLNWDVNNQGVVTNFAITDCAGPHRFEVASREDLAVYPTSEFGKDADMPSLARQAELREELCQGAALNYLDGKYDPLGKYSIAPILPPADAWAKGDRTLLCGLQTTNASGKLQVTKGKVSQTDQANIAAPGQCREVDPRQIMRDVDCSQPHQLETVSVVNLHDQFTEGYPSLDDQNSYLSGLCTKAAQDYLGGEENLYQSTLQPYWGSVAESSWAGGTYSVNCSLIHFTPGSTEFSTMVGSAKDGKEAMTINGAPPTEQPVRRPFREDLQRP